MTFFVGIDVGGERKGYHVVINKNGNFYSCFKSQCPNEIARQVIQANPTVVAVDAPCKFAVSGKSRTAERELMSLGIYSFSTPTEQIAQNNRFYDWVFNGMRLYEALSLKYPIYEGENTSSKICVETFPNAIEKIMRKNLGMLGDGTKNKRRRSLLKALGYAEENLPNIDFVDAALCAIAAEKFHFKDCQFFGTYNDGFIVTLKN